MVALLTTGGVLNGHGMPYFVVSCVGAAIFFLRQMLSWNVDDEKQSGDLFKVNAPSMKSGCLLSLQLAQSNGYLGFLIFAGMAVDNFWMGLASSST
jgi:hypothetical protein